MSENNNTDFFRQFIAVSISSSSVAAVIVERSGAELVCRVQRLRNVST